MNLGNQPVEIFIEDVYILAVPSSQNVVDPIEEAERTQSVKLERLENAELLQVKEQMTTPGWLDASFLLTLGLNLVRRHPQKPRPLGVPRHQNCEQRPGYNKKYSYKI